MIPSVACIGLLVADTVGAAIDTLPKRGTLELIDRIALHTGGCGANTTTGLAKLGVPVNLIGKVGRDGFGDFMVGALSQRGVGTAGVARDATEPTSATIVTVHSDAERSFLHVLGANATFTAKDVDWSAIEGAKILHIAGLQLLPAFEGDDVASVLAEAKRRGITTTLDTVMNPRSRWWDGLVAALPYLDWALPSLVEAERLTGTRDPMEQTRILKEAGAKNVVVKLDAEGCYVAPAEGTPFIAPPLTVTAVDSLGAGDAWVAGFLTGLVEGWSLDKIARFANAVGACCVTAYGSTDGIRSREETLALL